MVSLWVDTAGTNYNSNIVEGILALSVEFKCKENENSNSELSFNAAEYDIFSR